jgi:hypothetical protein
MFSPCFIEATNLLLVEEKASVIALINLGGFTLIESDNPPAIFIERDTEAKKYISDLENNGSPIGWRFLMDRYVCASDRGNWSIYCEKEEDVAVFAFREGLSQSVIFQVEGLLKAKSVRFSSTTGDSKLFDFGKLIPDWRATLLTEHTTPNV